MPVHIVKLDYDIKIIGKGEKELNDDFNKDIIMSHEPVYIPHEKTVVNIHGHTHQCNVHECYFIIDIENYDIKYMTSLLKILIL